ncbi:hypothetical protein V1460_05535 [Streptomyces sp. SCSIO 30461]|uniref:hypothetical protein n=1 Tax=Streptomyces sp. SCSIO 30461 TaxID=3118085 RepID=UPI0030D52BCD
MHGSAVVIVVVIGLFLVARLPAAHPDRPDRQYAITALAAAVMLLPSPLAHELSHAVVARRARRRGDGADRGRAHPRPDDPLTDALPAPESSPAHRTVVVADGAVVGVVTGSDVSRVTSWLASAGWRKRAA